VAAANVNQPKGLVEDARQAFALQTNDQLGKADDFRPIVIAYKDGAAIRLEDVAHVEDGVENASLAGWAGVQRAVIVNVQRQPGANIIQVVDRINKLLPQLRASMPQ